MLIVKDLSVEYADGKRAVDSVSLALAPGESVALVGANGAGKTTLLLALVGVLAAKSGEVFLDELALVKKTAPEFRARIGLVFQNPDDQLFMPNVFEDVAFGPRSFGHGEEETKERVENALDRLQISHLRDRSPLKLSGGEKRLAAIATVLSMQPEYMLFDEPTAYLDPRARRNLRRIVNDLPQGKLIATHDLTFAADTCSRVVMLKDGAVVADGGIDCLKDEGLLEAAGL
uniref:ABC transporter related protein n=1 Tax=uncultured bacterium contig00146 TaxID=1181586 RepID=A0A806KGP1_9BACT|nr:ABC transporter related protein [uncultured bacterium contig00146]